MTSPAAWAQDSLLPAEMGAGLLRVDLGPGIVAGFTTRHGGVSPAPWSSLNLGTGTGDEVARVRHNRERLAQWVGAPVVFATQVHGDGVLAVDAAEAQRWHADEVPTSAGEADALVTAEVGTALGVLVADCVPVLLADPVARLVATVHAGRRGLAAGIVTRAVDALLAAGARPGDLRAAVGPAVSGARYEVPAAMRDEVARLVPEAWTTTADGTPGLDLPAGVIAQLRARGVAVEHVDRCTVADDDLFSHRRASTVGAVTGRQAGVVVLH